MSPINCEKCGQGCPSSAHLARHLKDDHGMEVSAAIREARAVKERHQDAVERVRAAGPASLAACKALIAWYEGEVKEYEKAAAERTEWVGMSEFEALLQDGDKDLAVNDPALVAVVELARAAIREAA